MIFNVFVKQRIAITSSDNNQYSKTFSQEELRYLDKGLNFAIIPSCAPVLEILTDVESSITYLPNVRKEDIRTNTKKIILEQRATEIYRRNRSSEEKEKEREIPKQLNSKDCMYVEADKSDHVVILDAEEYDKRMYQLIDEGPYRMTLQNPLNEMINEAKKGIHFALKRT
jgi:hypothetical protein